MMQKIKTLLKKKTTWAIIVIVVAGGGYYGYKKIHSTSAATRYVTAAVSRGTLTSSVTGTGQVATTDTVDIKPQGSGAITSVKVQQGQQVKAGDVIATLDEQTASNQINAAKVSVAQAQANYAKVVAGAASTDVATAQLAVSSAQQSLDNAKKNYPLVVVQQQRAVDKAHVAIYNDGLQALPSDTLSTATVTISGNNNSTAQGEYDINIAETPGSLYYNVTGLANSNGQLIRGLQLPIGNGLYVTFSTTGTLVSSTRWAITVPNTRASTYPTDVDAYNAAVQNQIQALSQAQQQIDTAQNQLDQAQTQLAAKQAPPASADVLSAQAQIDSAQVQLANAEVAYANNIVKAPFDGVISKVALQKGDSASAGTALATIITNQTIAQVSLNEVDAAKVKVGQKATLTFSAIDGLSVTGEVGQIDLVGTVTQNVVTYSVKILFDTQDSRVKPGMSVSAAIITNVVQDVLSVPSAAVKNSSGSSYVQVLVNGAPEQHNVTVGISSDTDTEVSGDIKEGDQVVTQTITAAAAKTATSNTSILQSIGGAGARGAGGGGFGGGGGGAGRQGN